MNQNNNNLPIPNMNYPVVPGQVYQDLENRNTPRNYMGVIRDSETEEILGLGQFLQRIGETLGARCSTPNGTRLMDKLVKPVDLNYRNKNFETGTLKDEAYAHGRTDPSATYEALNPASAPQGVRDAIGTSTNFTPLDQFNIKNILGLDILGNINLSLTNMGLFVTLSTILIIYLYVINNNYNKLVPNNMSASSESIYATVHGIVVGQINSKKGQEYFPLIFVLFIFILTNNLIGMVPYAFATTSHFILTFSLSFTIVLGATYLGFFIHKSKFFSLFVPSGCPLALLYLLVLIEFISYLSRPVSLGLRLAANVLSGHMLLNILGGFTYNIMRSGAVQFVLGLLPLAFVIAFSGLEVGVAFIQAQVFVVLSCSYIKDGLDLH